MTADHYLNGSNEITALEKRVAALEHSHLSLRSDLNANTAMTASVKVDTAALVEFTNAMRGFATFCRWVGRGLRIVGLYVAPIALAVIALWQTIKGVKAP